MSSLTPHGADSSTCSILDVPGPRWFHPGDPIWRVHGDAATPIGITTGLLMLVANPAFAAVLSACGVEDSPWTVDDYLHALDQILPRQTQANLPLACQIAELPKTIKGYGPIRQPHAAAARQQWQQWLAQGFSAQPGPGGAQRT